MLSNMVSICFNSFPSVLICRCIVHVVSLLSCRICDHLKHLISLPEVCCQTAPWQTWPGWPKTGMGQSRGANQHLGIVYYHMIIYDHLWSTFSLFKSLKILKKMILISEVPQCPPWAMRSSGDHGENHWVWSRHDGVQRKLMIKLEVSIGCVDMALTMEKLWNAMESLGTTSGFWEGQCRQVVSHFSRWDLSHQGISTLP